MDVYDEEAARALGRRLAAARTAAGMTQDAAATAIGAAGKGTISAYEKGRNIPNAIALGLLARAYGVSADALLSDSPASAEALQLAVQFDALEPHQRGAFLAGARAFFSAAHASAAHTAELHEFEAALLSVPEDFRQLAAHDAIRAVTSVLDKLEATERKSSAPRMAHGKARKPVRGA